MRYFFLTLTGVLFGACFAFTQCLSGVYTLGRKGDFETLDSLQKRLEQSGVCGPVKVLLLAGRHTGSLRLRPQMKISPSNTLTLEAADPRAGAAVWTGSGNNALLNIEKSGHVRLRNLVLDANFYSIVGALEAENVVLENCRLEGKDDFNPPVHFEKSRGLRLENCQIDYQSAAVFAFESREIALLNCLVRYAKYPFSGDQWSAIRAFESQNLRVEGCTLEGLAKFSACRQIVFVKNESLNEKSLSPEPTNLELSRCDTAHISGNLFAATGTQFAPLVEISEQRGLDFWHNTLTSDGGGRLFRVSAAAWPPLTEKNVYIQNNLFASKGGGEAMAIGMETAFFTSDRNVFETSAAAVVNGVSLQQWQSTSGQDASSAKGAVTFFSKKEPRITGNPAILSGKALFLSGVSSADLDGDPRVAGASDIGADQFSGISTDLKVTETNLGTGACGGTPRVLVKLRNDGASTARIAKIRWQIAGDTSKTPVIWRGALAAGQTTDWIELGRHSLYSPVSNDLRVAVEQSRDAVPANNIFEKKGFKNAVGGVKTVGGAGADYLHLNEAFEHISSAGLCAETELVLLQKGHDEAVLKGLPGVASVPRLTVRPAQAGTAEAFCPKLLLVNVRNVRFDRFDIGTLEWQDLSKSLEFSSCRFIERVNDQSIDENLVFRNCDFQTNSVDLRGVPNTEDKGLRLENCRFGSDTDPDPAQYVAVSWQKDVVVSGCDFRRSARFDITFWKNPVRIVRNRFGSTAGAFAAYECAGTAADPILIANNFFACRGKMTLNFGQARPLVYLTGSERVHFLHNSVLCSPENDSFSMPAALYVYDLQYCLFQRNLIKAHREATIWDAQASVSWSINSFNWNTYDPGPKGIVPQWRSLSAWQKASLIDTNSVVSSVLFAAEQDPTGFSLDLHLAADSPQFPSIAGVFPSVPSDFDAQPRSGPLVNIGADETKALSFSGQVWPGDADADRSVTALDWLHFGLAMGQNLSGPPRADPSITWAPKYAAEWPANVQNVNAKHADANGDGVLSLADTAAIALNFGRQRFVFQSAEDRSGTPLRIDLPAGPYAAGQKIAAPILLGTAPESFYGLAFDIDFSPNSIKTGSFWVDFAGNWLGADAIGFYEKSPFGADASIALTKTKGLDATGFGKIGTLHFEVGTTADSVQIRLSAARGIEASGALKTITPTQPPIVSNANDLAFQSGISLSPNPLYRGEKLNLTLDNDRFGDCKVEIRTLDGRLFSSAAFQKTARKQAFALGILPAQTAFWVRISMGKASAARLIGRYE